MKAGTWIKKQVLDDDYKRAKIVSEYQEKLLDMTYKMGKEKIGEKWDINKIWKTCEKDVINGFTAITILVGASNYLNKKKDNDSEAKFRAEIAEKESADALRLISYIVALWWAASEGATDAKNL